MLKSKPELRFIGFENDWIHQSLDKVTERITRKNKNNESKLPLTISAQYGLVDQITYFNKQIASIDLSNYYLLQNGDFAYNKSYSKDYPWGVIKRLDKYKEGVLSSLYIVFKPLKVHSDFLVSYYETSRWHKEVSTRATEGARNHGLLNISAADFLKTNLSIPIDFEEQKKIGLFFKNLDETIDLHQQELDALKQTKQGFLQKMFPKDGESIPEIRFLNFKECWSKEKLGKVAPLRGGYAFKSNLFCGKGIPIIRISNIKSNGNIDGEFAYIQENPIYETYLLKNNSTLIAMSGATTGKVATIRDLKSKIYQNQRVGYFTKTDRINYEFLSTIVKSTFFKSKLKEILVAGAQPNISSKDIDNLEFFIPTNLEEQVRIGEFFRQLDEIIELKEKELEALKETKKGFLQKMFV